MMLKRRGSWINLLSQGRLDNVLEQKTKTLTVTKAVTRTAFLATSPQEKSAKDGRLSRRLILHPESSFVFYWNILLILLIVYESFAVPFVIFFGLQLQSSLGFFEFSITIVFLFDIGIFQAVLNFNVAFFYKGAFISGRIEIAKKYAELWYSLCRLWLDLLSSFPFPWLMGEFLSENPETIDSTWSGLSSIFRLMRVLRFLRILRLVRLAKLKRIFVRIEDYIASTTLANIFMFLRLLFVVFLLAHWTACLWYYISVNEAFDTDETWASLTMLSTQIEPFDLYVTALYFAFSTMSTVGYGDVHPYTRNEKIFGIFTMFLACAVFAYTVGSIGSLLTKSSAEESEHRSRVISVNRYMKKKDVPGSTQFRVRRYLEYLWDNQKKNFLKEREIIGMLSPSLRDEIYSCVHGSILMICPIFEGLENHMVSKLSKLFEGETFAPGDLIFAQGQITTKMYFVQSGKVTIYHGDTNSHFVTLSTNCFFGEIAFFIKTPRSASASCMNFVDLFTISREDLIEIAEELPVSKERLELLSARCARGDLSALQVRCYMCNELGHVATRCAKVLINFDHEQSKRKWLDSRKQQSKFVNPYFEANPNVERFHRPKLKVFYEVRNAVGKPRQVADLFNDEPQILQLIKDYEENVEEEQDYAVRQQSIKSKQDPTEPVRQRKPRFSIFTRDDSTESPKMEMVRSSSFRKSLMKKAPIIEMENYEAPERSQSVEDKEAAPFSPDPDKRLQHMRTEAPTKVHFKDTDSRISESDLEVDFSPDSRSFLGATKRFLD